MKNTLFNKDLICTQDWSKEELCNILCLAADMKQNRFDERYSSLMKQQSFLMFFYSPSVRTHLSFESAATELGGHAQFLTPSMGRFHSYSQFGETIEDAAQVMSHYVAAIGIRIMEENVSSYGEGNEMIREYAKWASVPVINMADDCFHPCQGLADILGWAEWFNHQEELSYQLDLSKLKKKKLLVTWAKGGLVRSWNSIQASLLAASRFGMDITLARPTGYDLDPTVYQNIQKNSLNEDGEFNIIDDPEQGYIDADIVYSRNWISAEAYQDNRLQKQIERERAFRHVEWITTKEKMKLTNNAIFTHPMPVDRGNEVENEVASGENSVIYNIAENRLHIQKAILASLTTEALPKMEFKLII